MCRKRNGRLPFVLLFAKIKNLLTRTLDKRLAIDSNRQ